MKVKVSLIYSKVYDIDPADYVEQNPELFDEEGQLLDERDFLDEVEASYNDDPDMFLEREPAYEVIVQKAP